MTRLATLLAFAAGVGVDHAWRHAEDAAPLTTRALPEPTSQAALDTPARNTSAPSAVIIELRTKLSALPQGYAHQGLAEKELADQTALAAFYADPKAQVCG